MTTLDTPETPAVVDLTPQILLGEVAVVDDTGPPRGTRYRPVSWTRLLWLTPAALLLGLAVVWPVGRTLQRVLVDAGVSGLRQVATDPVSQRAAALTVAWTVLVPLVVVTLGYLLAVSMHRTRLGAIGTALLVAPMALPMVVTGITFRLFYDPDPGRGGASLLVSAFGVAPPLWLGPGLVTFSLMSAFVWAWVGLAVVVFRAALDGFPHELLDAARIEGASGWELFRAVRLPVLRPIAVLLFALVGVATARSFDLLLVTAPESVRDDAIVLPWYIWQRSGDPEVAPVLSLVWIAILAVWVALASWGGRQQWPLPFRLPERRPNAERWWRRRRGRRSVVAVTGLLSRLVVGFAVLAWALPLVLLVATALRSPVNASTTSWASELSMDSFVELFNETSMREALVRTGLLATVVTAIVVPVGALAGYALVWLGSPGRPGTAVVLLLAAAVIPVQVVVGPVSEALGLAGASPVLTLMVIHIAIGVPYTVLVFRQAFASVPADRIRRARLGRFSAVPVSRVRRVWRLAWAEWNVLRTVVLRAARPAVVALGALEFIQVWNDLVVSLLVRAPEAAPIGPLLLTEAREFSSSAGVLAAGSVIASLVPMVVVVLARRHIVAAMVSGVVVRR